MKTMTATEASRSFAALLDDVEQGETVVITRAGKRIASVEPATTPNGAAVIAALKMPVDEQFAADVMSVRELLADDLTPWPEG